MGREEKLFLCALGQWMRTVNEAYKRQITARKGYCACAKVSHKKKGKPKEVVKLESSNSILTQGDKLWKSDQTKEKHFRLVGVASCGR